MRNWIYISLLCLFTMPCHATKVQKTLYGYDGSRDCVINRPTENVAFGSTVWSYEQNNRKNNDERAARFLSKDIIGCSLLDFGCNEGGVLLACRRLGASTITGVDYNAWCIEQAKKKVKQNAIPDAHFLVGDMENKGLYQRLPTADTVFLLAILDTSQFAHKQAIIADVCRHAGNTLYYEGHQTKDSHVKRMYELLIYTDFTRFEYLGHYDGRMLIRCSRELITSKEIPKGAITSDSPETNLQSAREIYVYTDSPTNPTFGANCHLIQYVSR
jgi:ubiquinone/menaquinone biosynthesis C-methylase UbiE